MSRQALEILGFWHEDDMPVKEADFADKLARGSVRFSQFLEARKITTNAIHPTGLRKHVEKILRKKL